MESKFVQTQDIVAQNSLKEIVLSFLVRFEIDQKELKQF